MVGEEGGDGEGREGGRVENVSIPHSPFVFYQGCSHPVLPSGHDTGALGMVEVCCLGVVEGMEANGPC